MHFDESLWKLTSGPNDWSNFRLFYILNSILSALGPKNLLKPKTFFFLFWIFWKMRFLQTRQGNVLRAQFAPTLRASIISLGIKKVNEKSWKSWKGRFSYWNIKQLMKIDPPNTIPPFLAPPADGPPYFFDLLYSI